MSDPGEPRPTDIDDDTIGTLLDAARAATAYAWVPYSSFPVGAAVLTDDGSVVSGVNIENASYGLTVCGERVAIFTAAARGHRALRAVAVSAPRAAGTSPCGACRQVINEFRPEGGDVVVILDRGVGAEPDVTSLDALLPNAFGPRNLT